MYTVVMGIQRMLAVVADVRRPSGTYVMMTTLLAMLPPVAWSWW